MLSMRGFILVCIIIQPKLSLAPRRKINGPALLFFKWMKKWKEEVGDNQSLYKTEVKADKKSKYVLRGNIITTV
jgi:hypothetical protein